MLDRVQVKNYRGFPNYKMDGLSSINLLVGLNNSGKSSILEAIHFLASGGDPSMLQQAALRRGELVMRGPDNQPILVDVSHFFFGHQLALDSEFSLSAGDESNRVSVKVISLPEDERNQVSSTKIGQTPNRIALKIEGGRRRPHEPRIYPLTKDGGVSFDDFSPWRSMNPVFRERMTHGRVLQQPERPSRFLGTDLVDSGSLAEMLDAVALSGSESMLADALKLLDNKLQYIRQLSGLTTHGYFGNRAGVVAKLDSPEFLVPLGSLGEGMRRMLALAAALATARGGFLFIDEIDTGLHYSVMHKMWELVTTTAVSYGIQVFAATHSYDCILGMAKMFKAQPDLKDVVALHRIESGNCESVRFDPQEILTAIREEIEIR